MKFSKYILKIAVLCLALFTSSGAFAQTLTTPNGAADPTQSSFSIVVCDGPDLPTAPINLLQKANDEMQKAQERNYIPCNFNGAMLTVQHLINIFLVLGVFAAIILFTYAGFLLMTGKEADRKKAKDIFPKIGIGFLVMLSAWFIVFQILNWLTGNPAFTKLLGS